MFGYMNIDPLALTLPWLRWRPAPLRPFGPGVPAAGSRADAWLQAAQYTGLIPKAVVLARLMCLSSFMPYL
jgi:hypothetical protein